MLVKFKFDKNLQVTKEKATLTLVAQAPKVILVNKFTEESAKSFRDDFAAALDTGQDVVPIVIDSYGGYVHSLLSMVDVVSVSPKPVITFATGKAMSCGAVLFTCGKKRYIAESATLMIHDVSSFAFGKVGKMKISVKESKRLNKRIFEIMETNIGKDKDYLWNIIEKKNREDWFITAKKAKKHNIATNIGIPQVEVSVSMKTSFR